MLCPLEQRQKNEIVQGRESYRKIIIIIYIADDSPMGSTRTRLDSTLSFIGSPDPYLHFLLLPNFSVGADHEVRQGSQIT